MELAVILVPRLSFVLLRLPVMARLVVPFRGHGIYYIQYGNSMAMKLTTVISTAHLLQA